MINFVNFARIASICVGFHLGTLHGYFFHQDFWPNLNFLLEDQIKLVLTCFTCDLIEFRSQTLMSDFSHVFLDISKILTNQNLISWQIQCFLD